MQHISNTLGENPLQSHRVLKDNRLRGDASHFINRIYKYRTSIDSIMLGILIIGIYEYSIKVTPENGITENLLTLISTKAFLVMLIFNRVNAIRDFIQAHKHKKALASITKPEIIDAHNTLITWGENLKEAGNRICDNEEKKRNYADIELIKTASELADIGATLSFHGTALLEANPSAPEDSFNTYVLDECFPDVMNESTYQSKAIQLIRKLNTFSLKSKTQEINNQA